MMNQANCGASSNQKEDEDIMIFASQLSKKKIITNVLEFDHVVQKCSFIQNKNCSNELTVKEIMVIFSTFKHFPWNWRDIRAPDTPTIVDSCKTTSIVITISSHENTPKPCDLMHTMAKVSIEFCKNEAVKTKSLRASNLQQTCSQQSSCETCNKEIPRIQDI